MKVKIKKSLKEFIDYTLTDEFKAMVMVSLFSFASICTVWDLVSTALTDKAVEVATEQHEEYLKLEEDYNSLKLDYNRLKMENDEVYELFYSCQTNDSWYEQFYYDNVDPYTGEVEGEYYE